MSFLTKRGSIPIVFWGQEVGSACSEKNCMRRKMTKKIDPETLKS